MFDSGKIRIFSAVLLSSTVFINTSQAMELELFEQPSRTPSKFIGEVVTQATQNVKDGYSTAKINFFAYRDAYSKGEYKPLLGLVIHGVISKYAKMSSFSKDGSLDPIAVRTAINNLTPHLMEYMERKMNERKDIYGISENGERVTIYEDKTFFGRIADSLIPANMPLRGMAVAFFNNPATEYELKNALNGQLAEKIEAIFRGSGFNVTPVNEVTDVVPSPSVVSFVSNEPLSATPSTTQVNSSSKAEEEIPSQVTTTTSSTFKKPMGYDLAYQYIWPHLQQYISGFLSDSLNGVAAQLMTEFDGYRNKCAVSVGGFGYTLGQFTFGTLGSAFTGFVSYVLGGAAFDVVGKEIKVELPKQIINFVHKTCGLPRETYVLSYLNPNPTEIERGLFGDDYELRDTLNRSTLTTFAAALFKNNNESSKISINDLSKLERFLNHTHLKRLNDQEGARRKFQFLSEEKKKAIETNIRTYPSYEMRMSQIEGKKPEKKQELKDIVGKINIHMEVVAKALKLNESQTNAAREKFLSLSVQDQDLFLEADEKTLLTELEGQNHTVVGFETLLKNVIKNFSHKKYEKYLEDNKDSLEVLKSVSLAEGLSENEIVLLHQQLMKKGKLSLVLEEHEKSKDFPETQSLKETYIEMLAKQHAVRLFEIFQEQIKEHGALENIKEQVKEKLSSMRKPLHDEPLNDEARKELLEFVVDALASNQTCETINQSILDFRNRNTNYETELEKIYKSTLNSVFQHQRSLYYSDIVQIVWVNMSEDVWEKAMPSKKSEQTKTDGNITNGKWSWGKLFYRSNSEPSQKEEKVETNEKNESIDIENLVKADEEKLQVFATVENDAPLSLDEGNYDPFEVQGLSILNDQDRSVAMREALLAKFVNDMKLSTVGALGDSEFNTINEQILTKQLKEMNSDDKKFFKMYKKQIIRKAYHIYPKDPFYSLKNTIDRMREENNNFMQKLFGQEKE